MKEWKLREAIPEDYLKNLDEPALPAGGQELARQFLFYRGIKIKKEAEYFLCPDYERDLKDPLKILNMPKAVKRILKAIRDNEKIIIFGDYDADGVCASVLFYQFFRKIGFENFDIYIPDRHQEGYGLTLEAVEKFIKEEVNLIITLDCGISDFEEIKKAQEAGVDVIVIDHHLVPKNLPLAFTILDLHQPGEKYPFKYFAGAGLAFKAVEALIKKGDFNIKPGWSKWLLDIVALATIADMVPLLDENRVLTYYGFIVLKKTRRLGLRYLYQILKLDLANINQDDIGFLVAPRINTASRMGHATTSFELLTTNSPNEAEWLARDLEEKNKQRKDLVEEILKEIDEKFKDEKDLPDVLVAGDEKWPPGVSGLLANRLIDRYLRPVFVWAKGEAEHRKGSARSNGEVNLVELMKVMPKSTFIDSGGHAPAAGFTLRDEVKKEDFEKNIQLAFEEINPHTKFGVGVKKEKAEPEVLWIDKELSLDKVNWDLVNLLEKFQPFGMANPKPIFLFSSIEIFEVKTFGNDGVHLELRFKKPNNELISAIGFFMENGFSLKKGSQIDLAASIEKSTFRGYNEIRLRIVDVKAL